MFTRLIESLPFRFALFHTTGSSHQCLVVERATTFPGQNLDVLKRAVRDYIKYSLGSSIEADIHAWDVRPVLIPD